jgi:hypothetical protein
MVRVGPYPAEETKLLPSTTNRFGSSCDWLNLFRTLFLGSFPIRQVPISWIIEPGGLKGADTSETTSSMVVVNTTPHSGGTQTLLPPASGGYNRMRDVRSLISYWRRRPPDISSVVCDGARSPLTIRRSRRHYGASDFRPLIWLETIGGTS